MFLIKFVYCLKYKNTNKKDQGII